MVEGSSGFERVLAQARFVLPPLGWLELSSQEYVGGEPIICGTIGADRP